MSQAVALRGLSTVFGGPGATSPGLITGSLGQTTDGDTDVVAVVGDSIATHGPAPHIGATMIQGSVSCFVNGLPLCRLGDAASCGCVVIGPCSTDTFCA
jgi:uncharacterized Zn-binding protein involved in type VI secretion